MIEERSIRLLDALEGRTETLLGMLQEERGQRQSLQRQLSELERRLAELEASRMELQEENRELDEQNRELEEHNRHLHECLAGNEKAGGFLRPARRSQGLSALIGHRASSSKSADAEAAPAASSVSDVSVSEVSASDTSASDTSVSRPDAAPSAAPSADAPRPAAEAEVRDADQGALPIGEAPSPHALLSEWYQRYGEAFFKGHTRPLKVGIHEELVAREPWPEKLVRRALACYVNLPRYLKAVREGAERIDLDGKAAGVVDAAAADYARRKLDRLQAEAPQRHDRGVSNKEQQPQARRQHKNANRKGKVESGAGSKPGKSKKSDAKSRGGAKPLASGLETASAPATLEEKLHALMAKHNSH